jgi:hypothetical protein
MPTDLIAEYETEFDRKWAVLDLARTEDRTTPAVFPDRPFPSHLRFGYHGNAYEYCLFGWNHPETEFAWTGSSEVVLHLPPAPTEDTYLLNMRVAPFVAGPIRRQRVSLSVGGELVAQWSISHPGHYFALLFDRHLAQKQDLVFHLPDGSSPRELGINADDRQLGLLFYEVWLTPWQGISL